MLKMTSAIWGFSQSESGSVAVTIAILFPLMAGMVGAGVDISHWLQQKRALQTAVDAAAMAGAYELANGRSEAEAEAAALREAAANGYAGGADNLAVTFPTDEDDNQQVHTVGSQELEVWFSSILFSGDVRASTAATAEVSGDGGFCFLSLSQTADQAISTSGAVTIDSQNCGVADNSNSESALYLNGNVFLNVGDVKIVGDYETVGGSVEFDYQTLRTDAAATSNPYSDLEVDSYTGCTQAQQRAGPTRYNSDATLNPGVYCGGITITGNNDITLNPGTYVLDGGNFDVSGGGSITAVGVTIVLTNSGGSSYGTYGNFDVSGGKDMYFTAPTTGAYAGIAVYQDGNTPAGDNRLTGTSGLTLDGVFYAPSGSLDFGGNGAASNADATTCSKLIADTLTFHGTPHLGNDCDGKETASIGGGTVTLVE